MLYRKFFYNSILHRLSRPVVVFVMTCYAFAVLSATMETGLSVITLVLLVSWVVIGIPAFVSSINAWPEIRVSDEYFCMRYFFSWLQIPWNEVLGLMLEKYSLLGRFCFVHFRKLPFLYRFFHSHAPYVSKSKVATSFLVVYENITNYEDLVAIITAKIEDPTVKLDV